MTEKSDDFQKDKKKPRLDSRLIEKVWLTIILMIGGGCISVIVIVLLISWLFKLPLHLP